MTKVLDGNLSKGIEYGYDAAGLRTRVVNPEDAVIAYAYDDAGRMTQVTEDGAMRAEWLLDLASRVTKRTLGNSSYSTYAYDTAGQLTALFNKKSDNSTISSFEYLRDDVGNPTKMTLASGHTVEYVYDAAYQLTSETRNDDQAALQYYNYFHYDPAGNRTQLVHNDGQAATTTTYLYNEADQLTKESVGGADTTYAYDAAGSLTHKDDGTNTWSYWYSARNRLTKHDAPGTENDSTYAYDLLERRIRKTVDGTTTRFFYDSWDVIADYDGSATPQVQATYVTPGMDQNVSMTRSGSVCYFLTDHLGSIRQLVDTNETVQNAYDYEAFGSAYGTPTENVTNTRRFTARERDAETGWQYHLNRYYLARCSGWNRRDPLKFHDSGTPYQYSMNSPLVWSDPLGLKVELVLTPAFGDFVGDTLGLSHCAIVITKLVQGEEGAAATTVIVVYEVGPEPNLGLTVDDGGVSAKTAGTGLGIVSGGSSGTSTGGTTGGTTGATTGGTTGATTGGTSGATTGGVADACTDGGADVGSGLAGPQRSYGDNRPNATARYVLDESHNSDDKYEAAATSVKYRTYDASTNNCCHWARQVIEASGSHWPIREAINHGFNPGYTPPSGRGSDTAVLDLMDSKETNSRDPNRRRRIMTSGDILRLYREYEK